MEKRNTLLLTVIAVATLLVAVVGATFAYFASNQDDWNTANVALTTNTAGTASVFDAAGTAMHLDVTEELMNETLNNTVNPAVTNTATLTVNFLSGTNDYAMTCTYDINFAWDSGSDQYTAHSLDNTIPNKEFTVQVTRTPSETTTGALGTNVANSEVELYTAVGTVVDDATIKNASQSTKTTHTWTITTKFYNLPTNQKELANKHYNGKFTVANVLCSAD